MSEKFSLKWNDFQSNISKTFGSVRTEEYLCDVTLVSDDSRQVSAHKLVLSACSEYFKDIFRKNQKHNHLLLCLDGITSNDLTNVLDYIYNGEVLVFQDDLDRFLEMAQKFKLEGLLGSEIQNEYKPFHDSESIMKEDEISNEDSFNNIVESENKYFQKSKQQVSKFDGTVSMNENGSESSEVKEKVAEYVEKSSDGNYHCKICRKMCGMWLTNARNHIETHLEGLSFPCHICGKTYRSRNTYKAHFSKKRCVK